MRCTTSISTGGLWQNAVLVMLIAGASFQARADQAITLRSGNGAIGSQDAQVHFLAYGATGNITPSAQNFVSVQTGTFAYVDAPYTTYLQQLPTDSLAQWVGTTNALGGGSALYAIPFTVTDSVIGSATLDLGYAVDNAINGVYINGMPISNNPLDGDYHGEYYVLRSDIAPLLQPNSVNWLYLNVSDYGDLSGLIFSARINISGGSAATPGISPNQGGNAGQVTVSVVGSGFQPDAQLTLTGVGPTITATNLTVVSPNLLTAILNLEGATPGVGTITVTNVSEGTSKTLNDAFTVQAGGAANLLIQKIATPAVNARNQTFFITITNNGELDSGPTPVSEVLEPGYTFVSSTPAPITVETLAFPTGAAPSDFALEWNLPNVPAAQSLEVTYTVTVNPAFPAGSTVIGPSCLQNVASSCLQNLAANLTSTQELLDACVELADATEGTVAPACASLLGAELANYLGCMALNGIQCAFVNSPVRASVDPNDLTGPSGYGPQLWIAAPQQMQYTLAFNNLPTATNAATNVMATDTFDASTLDLTTLVVNAVAVGNNTYELPNIPLATQPFSQDIDLRTAQNLLVRVTGDLNQTTNQAELSFLSLDPATGLTPADPTVGFLAPGEGGSAVFSVNPKPGFTTGTTIQDSGAVVFDSNPSISTNGWSNSIDKTPPTSSVQPLPAIEPDANFTVTWTGTDAGSGIQYYNIYASDNGGAFTPWQQNTTATSAPFIPQLGHTYGFYSIATDNVGNVEAAKTSAESATVIQDFALAVATTTATVAPGSAATYTLSLTGEGGFNQSVSFTCTGAPSGATCTANPSLATAGSMAANVNVTVTTMAPSVSGPRPWRTPPVPPLYPALRSLWIWATLLAAFAWRAARQTLGSSGQRKHALAPLAAVLLLTLALAGCGGGGGGGGSTNVSSAPGTPAGTYQLTVTGTTGSGSSTLSHSVTLTLTVS